MRFSGHETFAVRDGWLHKGLSLLSHQPEEFHSPHIADYLGVGKNMGRSIKHWLLAAKLAEADSEHRSRIRVSTFGICVEENDPYFTQPATWWLLHINLVSEPVYADTWAWFFNVFSMDRFERATAVENLRQHLQAKSQKLPSPTTLDRDVACLLTSYARQVPEDDSDPEDSRDCPFQDLGLMSFFRASGYYQINRSPKPILPEVLAYSLSVATADTLSGGEVTEIGVVESARVAGGPGRAFALDPEGVFELALQAEASGRTGLEVIGHAGRRMIRIPQRKPIEWASMLYKNLLKAEVHDAAR